MKLRAIILASSLMITGSIHSMYENVILIQSKEDKQEERRAKCFVCLGLTCCCPCMAVKCILSAICPTIVVNVNQAPNTSK